MSLLMLECIFCVYKFINVPINEKRLITAPILNCLLGTVLASFDHPLLVASIKQTSLQLIGFALRLIIIGEHEQLRHFYKTALLDGNWQVFYRTTIKFA